MPGKHLTDEFLKEIAEEYREYRQTEGQYKPNQRLADAHGVGLPRAYSWIKAARYRGILEEHTRTQCKACEQTFASLPPTIPHHHAASKKRMRDNASELEERCKVLSRQATSQKRPEDALAYRTAAYHYRAIAHLLV